MQGLVGSRPLRWRLHRARYASPLLSTSDPLNKRARSKANNRKASSNSCGGSTPKPPSPSGLFPQSQNDSPFSRRHPSFVPHLAPAWLALRTSLCIALQTGPALRHPASVESVPAEPPRYWSNASTMADQRESSMSVRRPFWRTEGEPSVDLAVATSKCTVARANFAASHHERGGSRKAREARALWR